MTEREWLTCADPAVMLRFVRGRVTERKLRLYLVACCRLTWHLVRDSRSHRAIEAAEQHADGEISDEQLQAVRAAALRWEDLMARQEFEEIAYARMACEAARRPLYWGSLDWAWGTPALMRCVFGNPFRSPRLDAAAARNETVVQLAQVTYAKRELSSDHLDRSRHAILADALQEAGCSDTDVLGHLRGPEPHVRGCWVVDLLLHKE
jgi:hypothetical protein